MGFNIGGIIAGGSRAATSIMQSRMKAHEKSLLDTATQEERLRTAAEIQEEFEDRKDKKDRERKAKDNAKLLSVYGYDSDSAAYWLAAGDDGFKQGVELGQLALKNGVDPNTLINSPSFDGSPKAIDDAKTIAVDTSEQEDNKLSQTENVFMSGLNRSNIASLYAPEAKSLTSSVQYANAIQAEINAKTTDELIKARKVSNYWLNAMQKEAEKKRAPEKVNEDGLANTKITPDIHYRHKESYLKQAGFATDINGRIKQITEGKLGIAGVAYVNAAFDSRYVNTRKSDGETIDTIFESIVDATLQNAANIFDRHVDYATANNKFQAGKVFESKEAAQQYADSNFGKNAGGQVFQFYGKDRDGNFGKITATYVGKEFYEGSGHKFYISNFDIIPQDRGN